MQELRRLVFERRDEKYTFKEFPYCLKQYHTKGIKCDN